jgi:hypothetical protein
VSTPAASLAFALAFALALGFHRYRAAQICALLALLALGVDAGSLLLREAALRLLPWLVLACALIPEPRLLSRRHAALVLFTGSLLLVALYAPPRLLAMPLQMSAWPLPGLDPGRGARLLLMLAAAVCALRFLRQRQPMEAGLVAGLLLAAIGAGRPTELSTWLLASALTATVAVLYSSYRMAFVDPLSALPNRRALDETLGRLSGSYSLAMIDIDHFKAFNDQHGHAAGDALPSVSARPPAARCSATVARSSVWSMPGWMPSWLGNVWKRHEWPCKTRSWSCLRQRNRQAKPHRKARPSLGRRPDLRAPSRSRSPSAPAWLPAASVASRPATCSRPPIRRSTRPKQKAAIGLNAAAENGNPAPRSSPAMHPESPR